MAVSHAVRADWAALKRKDELERMKAELFSFYSSFILAVHRSRRVRSNDLLYPAPISAHLEGVANLRQQSTFDSV